MKEIILIGGGGHCKACIDVIETTGLYQIAGIIDTKDKIGEKVLGYSIIGCDDDIPKLSKTYNYFFITIGQIGEPKLRRQLFVKLKTLKLTLPVIISPHAYVSKHTIIGEGSIIMHHACVNAGASVGENCIINTKALIEHDATINNHTHIATGAIINGGVIVGENCFIGSGAVTKQMIKIQANQFIKAHTIAT
ncbi:MAG: acetyltransferase [Salinivirgaceae bacterium]|jgi:sugar O-acyltransferase (sialic acid O-acetyltransferase NeuD family)|nr:acetyltransferase [Salinivirgaceae bacterium]